ncbi:MAG: hypothetical protein DMG13_11915 [Acidobacteria bacterium]|nr:MAG: hypothetical protein DMG13_11915 [Acidobacteriota bacterium]
MTLDDHLAASADPDAARANYQRFSEAGGRIPGDQPGRAALATILGGSPFLAEVLIRNPEHLDWLTAELGSGRTKTRMEFLQAARCAMPGGILELHRFQRREILRIGARDLSGCFQMSDITKELSWLAEAVIQMALELACRELDERYGAADAGFAVAGVGKLGGEELNFSSDIDLIYIFSDETLTDRATKLARRITQILTEPTSEGSFYRVDLRLRPEGSRGTIASPIRVLQAYYDSWGETFERLALTKARVVAGDRDTGDRFMNLLQPFVYRKYLDFVAIDEVRDIKRRIDQQLERSIGLDRHVKLGRGGIREIEFFVQALQVLYGGELPGIRTPNTLDALDRLEEADIIDPEVGRRLRDAYVFLRNLEHKLQIIHQLQTHEIPADPGELEKCARRMCMPLAGFQSALAEHRDAVHRIFQELFAEKMSSPGRSGIAGAVHHFVNQNMDQKEARAWLASLGFSDPTQSAHNLELLRDAPAFGHSPSRMKNLLSNVLTPLIEITGGLIRPDAVLNGFERIVAGMGAREAFFTSLLENPKSLLRICRLLSFSDYLSEILFESPEVIDFLMDDSRLGRPQRSPFATEDRKLQEFYSGAQYFFGIILRRRANRILTRFAEREIRKVLPADSNVAIFAAGKLGERELNFRSDLDVIGFYSGDYSSALETVETLVRQLGPQFKVDMRLRPEGKKGPLVWSPERYRDYVRDRGETWERMALTKARFVAGDPALGRTIQQIIESFVYDRPFGKEQIEEMNAIRFRMENEIGRETESIWDLKVGRGGIVDIEFLVEYRQIQEKVRVPSTVVAMKGVGLNLLEEYEFLRDVESMLRLWSPLASTRIEEKDRQVLGLMLHVKDFTGQYKHVTDSVRRRFEQGL